MAFIEFKRLNLSAKLRRKIMVSVVMGKRFFQIVFLSFCCTGLLGCITESAQRDPLKQSVAVTLTQPNMPITAHTPLSWYSDVIRVLDTAAPRQPTDRRGSQFAKIEIADQLQAKGYRLTQQATRYQLISLMTLGDDPATTYAKEMFKVYPALVGASKEYPKGTMALAIVDSKLGRAVWRSSVEAFVDPKAEASEKQARIRRYVIDLLKHLPNAKS